MISYNLSKHILTIGCDFLSPKGGVSQVLYNYKLYIFRNFKSITNSGGSNKCYKLLKFICAIILMFYQLLLDKDIKIVHIHTASYNSFKRSAIFAKLAKLFKKKVVLHIHGGGFKDYYATNPKWIASVLNQCDVIITLSNSWEQYFQSITNHPAIFIVENIVPFPVRITEEKNWKDGKCHLLFLGLIAKEKGIFDLIEVLHEGAKIFNDKVVLHIGGNGQTDLLNKKVKEYGLEDYIRYEGFVTGYKKDRLLHDVDVFILPSYTEGLPVSILEAMSYGKPILTTPVGGIPEIVKQDINGFLFQPGDKKEMLKAIEQIMNSKEKKKCMGERSFQMVQPFLPNHVELQLKKVYEWLLSQ